MENPEEKITEIKHDSKCKDCGAHLKFAPGTSHLKCEYCGAENKIETTIVEKIEEIDFEKFIASTIESTDKQEVNTVHCKSCGATTTLKPNVTSDHCPFCDTPMVVDKGSTTKIIKPKYVLPFKIEQKSAFENFKKWVNALWFAPNDLKAYAHSADKLNGMYLPYWTYDSKTSSNYTGLRGIHYYVTESYSTTENGRSVTRTRQVQKTRWTPAFGNVRNAFDDVLVLASNSLPDNYTRKLEPWDLKNLAEFNEKYLSGFRTECYQVDVKTGFEKAKPIMADVINNTIRRDIGGDVQQINTVNTSYNDITFKHILLPIWLSAYRYNQKVFRFMVNGRTGEVQGERPYSAIKIALLIITILVVLTALAYFYYSGQQRQ